MKFRHKLLWIALLCVQSVLCAEELLDSGVEPVVEEGQAVCKELYEAACGKGSCEEAECVSEKVVLPAEPYGEFCGRPVYIISASGCWDKDLLDVPQTVNIMSYEDLNEATVYKDLSHALEEIPNVNLGQVAYRTSFGATSSNWNQGISIRGLGLQRVVTVIDGVRQSGQGIGHGGGNLSLYDPYIIESVEVIKGPTSVAYGCDALGGVIAMISREPERRCEQGINGGSSYQLDSAQNFWRESVYVDVGDERYGLIVGGTYGEYDLPRLPKGAAADGGSMKKYGGWMKLNYYISDCATLTFLANRCNVRDITVKDETSKNWREEVDIPRYDRSELGVQLEVNDISECVECSLTAFSWGGVKNVQHSIWGPGVGFESDMLNRDSVNVYEFRQQFELDFCPHQLLVGLDLEVDTSVCKEQVNKLWQKTKEDVTRVDAQQTRLGLYVQDTWELDPCLDMVLGVRWDDYSMKNRVGGMECDDNGVSGSVAFNYKPTECHSCYLNLASGFRSPDLGERFQNTKIGKVSVDGDPNLSSERSAMIEVGTKCCDECFSYQASVFAMSVEDYITVKMKEVGAAYQYKNIGTVGLYGFEGQCVYRPDDYWRLYFTAGRTYTNERDKIALPSWVFNYGVSYEIPVCWGIVEKVTPELILRSAVASYDTLNGENNRWGLPFKYAGYTTVNAQVTLDLYSDPCLEGKLIMGISNLFNKAYMQSFFDQLQPGRGFFTSVQVGF